MPAVSSETFVASFTKIDVQHMLNKKTTMELCQLIGQVSRVIALP